MTTLPEPFHERESIAEVAVGERHDLAVRLRDQGHAVIVTDIHPRTVPDGIRFEQDDLQDPRIEVYHAVELLCARRLPEELQSAAVALAGRLHIPLVFTTLGFEVPAVPVEVISDVTTPTWYRARKPT